MAKSIREKELEQEIYNMTLQFKTELEQKEILLAGKNETIKDLRDKLAKYEKEFLYNKTDKEVVKKILSLYAKGDAYNTILEKLKYNRMPTDISTIKEICQNVEDLDNDMLVYYKEQVQLYEKSIKINPEVLKDSLYQYYKMLANEAALDMTKVTDIEERRKLREEMNKHLDKLNSVFKNIVDEKNGEFREVEDLKKEINDNFKVISFDRNKIIKMG